MQLFRRITSRAERMEAVPTEPRFLVARRTGMRRAVRILALLLLTISIFSATSYTAGPLSAGRMAPFMIIGALIAGAGLLPSRLLRRKLFTLDILGFVIATALVAEALAYAFELPTTAPFMLNIVSLVVVIAAVFLFWSPSFHLLWLIVTGTLTAVVVVAMPSLGVQEVFLVVTSIIASFLGHRFAWQAWLRRFADTAHIRELNRSLSIAVRTDLTTQVGNRRALDEAFVRVARGTIRHWAVLIIDIDHFKGVNDNDGHLRGDAVIAKIAEIIRSTVRDNDMVYRYGGDEFLVLLPDASIEIAQGVGERIRASVEAAAISNPGAPSGLLTLSIGAATSTHATGAGGPVPILKIADAALYSAKRAGRNRIAIGSFEAGAAATIRGSAEQASIPSPKLTAGPGSRF